MIDSNLAIRSGDPYSKEMLQLAEILHDKFRSQLHLYVRNDSSILASDEQIVNPNWNVDVSFGVDVKARVGARFDKVRRD